LPPWQEGLYLIAAPAIEATAAPTEGETMLRKRYLGFAAPLVAVIAATGVTPHATARPRANADRGTAAVATTPLTAGATQYVAGFDSDAILGHGAITYVITTIPTSAKGTFSLVAHHVIFYTGTGKLSGTATATLTATTGGDAAITGGKLTLTTGRGSLAGHSLVASFSGTGRLGGAYTFTYRGTYR
jgi:hypothetical protein